MTKLDARSENTNNDQNEVNLDLNFFSSLVDAIPVNVMYADNNLYIRYINKQSRKTLKRIEHLLPVKADDVVGSNIDIFHKHPEHQRKIMRDPNNLPHSAIIKLADEHLSLMISALNNADGKYIGAMLTWDVVTEKIKLENEVKEYNEREKIKMEKLKEKINVMLPVIQSLAASSEELSAVSTQMKNNSEETSNQANVVSAAAEEISKSLQTVSTNTLEFNKSINEIAKNTSEATRVALQAVKTAGETTEIIKLLGESSNEIGNIVKVITSIAQQTNLLALNATIEAARAGEAGNGFAVVANEVKELSKSTAKATDDISHKIEVIQDHTKNAVNAIAEISAIINQINEAQNTIASAIEEQSITTNEIGRNVSEAAKGGAEIAQNITNVAQVALSTTSGAIDSQKAAAELAKMAIELEKHAIELQS